ncbi:hypothetical protein [Mucilaginibacter sp. 22184]|uniref:hypothetical protein n=1 Tax=Mucilaginibacter sp. 22184 TaxID=3453887 RepID=UPI003F8371C1
MKSLLLLIIGIALMDSSTKGSQPGDLLSLPAYTIAIGRWYKDQPPYPKTRRGKKDRPRQRSQRYVFQYG